MQCELCLKTATEKHHVSYFPEVTMAVCHFHGDDIHNKPYKYGQFLQYPRGDSSYYYEQQERISKFLRYLSKLKRNSRMYY